MRCQSSLSSRDRKVIPDSNNYSNEVLLKLLSTSVSGLSLIWFVTTIWINIEVRFSHLIMLSLSLFFLFLSVVVQSSSLKIHERLRDFRLMTSCRAYITDRMRKRARRYGYNVRDVCIRLRLVSCYFLPRKTEIKSRELPRRRVT